MVISVNWLFKTLSSALSNPLFLSFLIISLGYLLGHIHIKGISLGSSAVFVVALIVGHFAYTDSSLLHRLGLITISCASLKTSMSLIQNLGLFCFATAVGLTAGPNFFPDLKQNLKSYVLLAMIIVGVGSCLCILIVLHTGTDSAMAVGLLSGSLTTTPGYAAAQEAVNGNERLLAEITVGHAVAYPFGVIGVVLFVQLIPKLLDADMEQERKQFRTVGLSSMRQARRLMEVEKSGLFGIAATVVIGVLIGAIKLPLPGGGTFSLGNTGGVLFAGLVVGHFGSIGHLSVKVQKETLSLLRELGLVLLLVGAGVPGGGNFVEILHEQGMILFLYGIIMTIVPMICGYFFARCVLKLPMLNNLGSITGGMTSTPALGSLISVSGTSNVASAYAATYPIALVLVVLSSQFIITLF